MEVSPLAIFFVKNGSNGDKMLFKYPYALDTDAGTTLKNNKRNPYSLGNNGNSMSNKPPPASSDNFSTGKLGHFIDDDLSYLLAVNKKLCGDKFELKVNDIRFVGHPVNLEDYKGNYPKEKDKEDRPSVSSILLFNIVFALKVTISHDIVNCYHDLSRRLGIALSYEEQRCHFLSQEAKIMLSELDEQSQQPEANRKSSVFQAILNKSLIAKHLRKVFIDLCNSGSVHLRLNDWIDISFCLPPKINLGFGSSKRISHEVLLTGLDKVKPYHTILLLVDRQELLTILSADGSPALRRLLHVESPINPFYTLAADADLTLPHVVDLAGHLVYWGKATIIYPVCNTNIYVLSPNVHTARMSRLVEKFQEEFPGWSYHQTLADFSLPISLKDKYTPMSLPQEQQQEKQKLLWMLRHGLLQQLHTYIYILPQSSSKTKLDLFAEYKVIAASKAKGGGSLSAPHSSSARGLLATVAEAITEKPCEETNSSCSSFKDDLDWHEEAKETHKGHNGTEGRTPSLKGGKEQLEDDQNSQDSTSSGFLNRKNSSSEDVNFSHQAFMKNLHHHIVSQSLTPSESDFGSVCSDDRSLSPGCASSQITEETVLQDLDILLSPSEKELVLNTEAAKNLEDLKLFSNLCRYFRGEHHMEEIMYRANIHRSQLLEILDKFRSILITVQRVDHSIYLGADRSS